MKKRNTRTGNVQRALFLFLSTVFLILILNCDILSSPSMPSEIIGVWESSGDYINQFTFTADNLAVRGWSTLWPGEFDYSYNSDLEAVYESESMIYTENDIYWTWYLESSTKMYLHKTNPGDIKPALSGTWWNDGSTGKYTLYKQ